jgi:hypothetical protein
MREPSKPGAQRPKGQTKSAESFTQPFKIWRASAEISRAILKITRETPKINPLNPQNQA